MIYFKARVALAVMALERRRKAVNWDEVAWKVGVFVASLGVTLLISIALNSEGKNVNWPKTLAIWWRLSSAVGGLVAFGVCWPKIVRWASSSERLLAELKKK